MTRDELRSARLLFGEELALGEVSAAALDTTDVAAAVRATPVPSPLSRRLQRAAQDRGRLTLVEGSVEPMVAARRAVLGDAAGGPPRFLVRVDAFPGTDAWADPGATEAFRALDTILRDAGVPYLVAVLPRVAREPLDASVEESRGHDWGERELLEALRDDAGRPGGPVGFGVHGLDHRQHAKRSELAGFKRKALVERLDAADAVLHVAGLPTDVLVPPWDRFEARQWNVLAERYDVVTGGPASVATTGWHRTPLWRGEAVWLPAHPPLAGPARAMVDAVRALEALQPALWLPLALEAAVERADGFAGLTELAAALAGLARPWDEFLAGVRASRGST